MKPFGGFHLSGLSRFLNPDPCEETTTLVFFWIGVGILILIGDYFSGPIIQFPLFYLLPVSLAAWYSGLLWGLSFAVCLPIIRFYFLTAIWNVPWSLGESLVNTGIRIIVLGSFAGLIHHTAQQTRQLARRVRILEGILPVCSFCKKIRDQQGQWHSMEQYISERSEAQFSHGFCPACGQLHYGKYLNPASGTPPVHPTEL